MYNDNISFCWKSKTGKIIKPTDETFDEEDLECWIENLKPAEYWKQVATEKKSHPFQIAKLSYEVKVFDFGVEMELRIFNEKILTGDLKVSISNTIEAYNNLSEKNGRKNGVVHNYKFIEEEDFLCVRIDTGSAGVTVINKILKSLSGNIAIKKIEIDI